MARETFDQTSAVTSLHEGREEPNIRTPILVAGLPGKMATLIAQQLIQDERFDLLHYAITSKRNRGKHLEFGDQRVDLIDYCPFDIKTRPGTIAVDFTNPQSAVTNAILYTSFRIPFVMGTTLSDRKQIEELVRNSEISAVVVANMAASAIDVQNTTRKYAEREKGDEARVAGILMTIRFLDRQMRAGVRGQVFSMADVLRGGEA